MIRDCEDCPSPAAPGHDLCESCHLRRLDEEAEASDELACAEDDGESVGPRGLMWGAE